MRPTSRHSYVAVITCFSFISFCTEKQPKAANLIHRRRDDKLKLIGGIRVQCEGARVSATTCQVVRGGSVLGQGLM